jgi:pimeloyl-ACP methyl ester carboxylesterase
VINDSLVDAGELPIAVRDFGGDNAPLVLLHGAGGNLAGLTALARALRPHHRVITLDLRSHGRSGDATWSWEAALADIAAVTVHLDLTAPAVVGHSLGGMLATLWGQRHPETRGVVSLDGNPPPTRPDQLPGLDPETATAELERLHATFDTMEATAGHSIPTAELPGIIEQQREAARAAGANEKLWIEAFRRNLVSKDGTTTTRPDSATIAALRTLTYELDLAPIQASTPAPTLSVLATRNLPEQESFAGLYEAYRAHLRRQADEASKANPNFRVISLTDTTHAFPVTHPELAARVITDFLGS